MLSIDFIRKNTEKVKNAALNKNRKVDIDRLLELDDIRVGHINSEQKLREERNIIASKRPPSPDEIERGRIIKDELKTIETELRKVEEELKNLSLHVPNVPLDEVPIGKDATSNLEIKKWGSIPEFDFEPKDHLALGKDLDILDMEKGSKISGFRGFFLKNEGAMLHMSLMFYVYKKLIGKGFSPFVAPSIVKSFTLFGTGHFPWGSEQDVYKLNEEDQYLSGTAEIPITAYHSDEILNEKDLPKKYVGFSPCYRREAGAYGKDTRGLYRVHEFWKIEQVVIGKSDINQARDMYFYHY